MSISNPERALANRNRIPHLGGCKEDIRGVAKVRISGFSVDPIDGRELEGRVQKISINALWTNSSVTGLHLI